MIVEAQRDDAGRAAAPAAPFNAWTALGKIAKSYYWGLAPAIYGIALAGVFGQQIYADACRFVKSSACVVVYLPELFKCDFSVPSYL